MEKSLVPSKGTVLSAMFLVAGCCIGGGMLALPVATGVNGFIPSLVVMVICWIMMTITGLLLLEVSLWMEEGVHVDTMTHRLLGNMGRGISWILYLFICYASLVAYTAAGGHQLAIAFDSVFNLPLTKELGCTIYILTFGLVLYLGSAIVGRVNAILFMAMLASYVALISIGMPEVQVTYLKYSHWTGFLLAIPLMLASFSYQTMVPSLTPYLKKNLKSLRLAIIGGTSITFIVYALWQCMMLGIVPVEGTHGLAQALIDGKPATLFLNEHVHGKYVASIAHFFAFFAVVTSFLGIALGLFDFLSDGLKIKKIGIGNVILGILIIVPTLVFATQFERVFVVALDSSGGYGDTILNGFIPVLMVWIGRYSKGYPAYFRVPGGKLLLSLVFVFFLLCLLLEIFVHTGYLSSVYEAYELIEKRIDI
ncbi:Tyrosine-specific transport protein|uniref:amino acid permease n=1 Tax=Neochlamydia sp. AcF84 TaxID=2315858 RepID=UPI00325BC647|nr:Tyrosine-specific transport protein [Neochlamydia sp. AcF84]